jgi:hypothetical protein
VVAAPGLRNMAARLTPFTRGKDVTPLLEVGTTVEDFWRQSGLDNIMGTLVLLTLSDARLVMLGAQNQSGLNSSVTLNPITHQPGDDTVVVPEADIEMRGVKRNENIVGDLHDLSRELDGSGISVAPKATDLRGTCKQII